MCELKLFDEKTFLDVVDADHLRVAAGKKAGAVGRVAQSCKEAFSFLQKKHKNNNEFESLIHLIILIRR